MEITETLLHGDVQGTLLKGAHCTSLGVLVLGGSSGRVDVARAKLFAVRGAVAIALRWFGGESQVPGICEVPLETFSLAVDRLVGEGCERIALIGTSKGAEAALLTAIYDQRVDVVVAISPSSVVWANIGAGRDGKEWPQRSSWTHRGIPLPFVPYDTAWRSQPGSGLISYRELHIQSLRTFAAEAKAAAILAEKASAAHILVAGSDDALWPSDIFARSIHERLVAAGRRACLVQHPRAGHRVLLPGETTPRSTQHAHGGTDQSDFELGQEAWSEILAQLRLPTSVV